MQFDAIIFDLDGTLLDTLKDIANSANKVLAQFGFATHQMDKYCYFVGDGVSVLVKRVLPEEQQGKADLVAQCIDAFRLDYIQHWKDQTGPYEGIAETLDELSRRRIPMAILSNKPDDFSHLCVDELLSHWHFEIVMGLKEGVAPKPDPGGALQIARQLGVKPERILYIGDTSIDMKTAVSAGMFPAGALWGFRTREELEVAGAMALLESPQDILSLLQE